MERRSKRLKWRRRFSGAFYLDESDAVVAKMLDLKSKHLREMEVFYASDEKAEEAPGGILYHADGEVREKERGKSE